MDILQFIRQMGPLPQTPLDVILPMAIAPFKPNADTMCRSCNFADTLANDVFCTINEQMNGELALEDMVRTLRCYKGRPIQREDDEMLVGYQVERALVQEYPASNHLITASVYSQHVAVQHQGCIHGQLV